MNMSNGSTTTYFVGTHYEVANGVVTKYYFAGSQRIALRTNGTLNYLLGDHLGSTSVTTDANGQVISEMRYKAWGETRYASGTTPTKYQYTGQYSYATDFGLHFYNARWYDSSLSRFASADTIVPGGIQGLDRYAYVNNAPLKYIDPSGHDPWWCKEASSSGACTLSYWTSYVANPEKIVDDYLADYGVTSTGLNYSQKYDAAKAAIASGERFYNAYGQSRGFTSPQDAFRKLHGNVSISYDPGRVDDCLTTSNGAGGSNIACASSALNFFDILHEFGHSMDIHLGLGLSNNLISFTDSEGNSIDGGYGNPWTRTTNGFKCDTFDCLGHPPSLGYGDGCENSQSGFCARNEQAADLYLNYVLFDTGDPNHGFTGTEGVARLDDFTNRLLRTVFNLYFP